MPPHQIPNDGHLGFSVFWFSIEEVSAGENAYGSNQSKIANLKSPAVIAALVIGLLAAPLAADAQPPKTAPRIGFLITGSPAAMAPFIDAFRQGLREHGYVEGQNTAGTGSSRRA